MKQGIITGAVFFIIPSLFWIGVFYLVLGFSGGNSNIWTPVYVLKWVVTFVVEALSSSFVGFSVTKQSGRLKMSIREE